MRLKPQKILCYYIKKTCRKVSFPYAIFSEGQIKVVHCYNRRKLKHSFSLLKSKLFNIVYIAKSKHFYKNYMLQQFNCDTEFLVEN